MTANLTWNQTGPCGGICSFTLTFGMSAVSLGIPVFPLRQVQRDCCHVPSVAQCVAVLGWPCASVLQVHTKGSQSWQVDNVDFVFDAKAYNISQKTEVKLSHSETLFKTQLQRAYKCSHVDIKDLTAANVSATAMVNIEEFELQAFSFSDNSSFDACKLFCHS